MGHKEKGDKARFRFVESRYRGKCKQNLLLESRFSQLDILTDVLQLTVVSTRLEQMSKFAVGNLRTFRFHECCWSIYKMLSADGRLRKCAGLVPADTADGQG